MQPASSSQKIRRPFSTSLSAKLDFLKSDVIFWHRVLCASLLSLLYTKYLVCLHFTAQCSASHSLTWIIGIAFQILHAQTWPTGFSPQICPIHSLPHLSSKQLYPFSDLNQTSSLISFFHILQAISPTYI